MPAISIGSNEDRSTGGDAASAEQSGQSVCARAIRGRSIFKIERVCRRNDLTDCECEATDVYRRRARYRNEARCGC